MAKRIWKTSPDSGTYRSLDNPAVHPRDDLAMLELFRGGMPVGDRWDPPEYGLFEDPGDSLKPIGDFLGFGGAPFLVVNSRALALLHPTVKDDLVEVLPLRSTLGELAVLNIGLVDCLDHSSSKLSYFSSGGIMSIDVYSFIYKRIQRKHIFRLPEEPMSGIFVDDAFKTIVEENRLEGLIFRGLSQV